MKAVVLRGIDEPLSIEEITKPIPGQNEVLIRLKAASFNKRDWWIQKGKYAGLKFPIVLGSDGSGIVEAIGEGVNKSIIGNEVVLYPAKNWGDKEAFQSKEFSIIGLPENGCFAQYISVPITNIYPKPSHLSYEEAATLPVAGLTAYRALFIRGNWQPGEKVLVSGVGGGAGTFALQWAVAAGAEVWVTSGSEEKIAKAMKLGAKGGINYKMENWHELLQTKAGEFDVIIDSALGDGFVQLTSLAARGARIVFFGGTDGNIPAINGRSIFWKQISILGTTLGSEKDFEQMLEFISAKKVNPVIDSVYTLTEVQTAMRAITSGERFGKIVLQID